MSGYKKQKKYCKKSYESTKGIGWDNFVALYESLLESQAGRELTPKQLQLYIYCRLQLHDKKNKPLPNDDLAFYMNQAKWSEKYNLYNKSNAKGFQRDIKQLISLGFIECIACGAVNYSSSIYKFSDMWQKYGTANFVINRNKMTYAMKKNLPPQAMVNQNTQQYGTAIAIHNTP